MRKFTIVLEKRIPHVDDTGGVAKYKKFQFLNWNENKKFSGKRIKIKGFLPYKKVNIF